VKDTEYDSADGNSFNNTLGVLVLELLPTKLCRMPSACLGSRSGDWVADLETDRSSRLPKRRQTPWSYPRDSLCLNCFASVLENTDADPVPIPAAAGAKQAFYE